MARLRIAAILVIGILVFGMIMALRQTVTSFPLHIGVSALGGACLGFVLVFALRRKR